MPTTVGQGVIKSIDMKAFVVIITEDSGDDITHNCMGPNPAWNIYNGGLKVGDRVIYNRIEEPDGIRVEELNKADTRGL